MRIELDEEATRAAEKACGQLGMSVNAYVNWLAVSVSSIELVESAAVTITPQPPVTARPRIARRRQSWSVKL